MRTSEAIYRDIKDVLKAKRINAEEAGYLDIAYEGLLAELDEAEEAEGRHEDE